MGKIKIASYWAAACGGCDTAILDIHEKIVDIVKVADVVFWPIAVDFKYRDVEAMPDKHIDVTLFHGAIRNSEGEHIAKLLRAKTKTLVAFGSCAHIGGIPSLANLYNKKILFETVYLKSFSTVNPNNVTPNPVTNVPEGELRIPEFYDTVKTLDQVVPVEYYVPGCPPTPKRIMEVLLAIASGNLPPVGSVIGASEKTQCDECERKKDNKKIKEFKRIATSIPDPNLCFLEQGYLCLGFVTRGGCDTRCQRSGVGCRGCYGPPPGVIDQGAKAISALGSIIDANNEEETEKIISQIPDLLRSVNRFGIAGSLLRRKIL